MRQVRDAAAVERASAIVANIGDVALAKRNIRRAIDNPLKSVPGEPVRFVRGARVRDQFTIK
jgi:hypothetical protein